MLTLHAQPLRSPGGLGVRQVVRAELVEWCRGTQATGRLPPSGDHLGVDTCSLFRCGIGSALSGREEVALPAMAETHVKRIVGATSSDEAPAFCSSSHSRCSCA